METVPIVYEHKLAWLQDGHVEQVGNQNQVNRPSALDAVED